jgi:hypothetical protein
MNPFSLLDVFTVDQATQAITGILNPADKDQVSKKSMVFNKLMEDINHGNLPAEKTEIQHCTPHRVGMRRISINDDTDHRPIVHRKFTTTICKISRADLLAWCEQRGIRPPWLFPDPPPADPPLNTKERNTLLDIIRALAELHGIKSSSEAYRKEAEALLMALAEKKIIAPCNDKTLAKHLKAAFNPR